MRESKDNGTCCNLFTLLFNAAAVVLQSLMTPINRVMWSLVGGEFDLMASLILPPGAQQQAGKSRAGQNPTRQRKNVMNLDHDGSRSLCSVVILNKCALV